MEEKKVEVIQKKDGPIVRDKRLAGLPITITKKRVAAYVRVSTNCEEQLQSFNSQKEYYLDKISANKKWELVGIYADEGITGTKTDKRDEFLRMIDDCMNGLVDIVITKSVSRFSRNLVDVLSYTRMLKAKGVTVVFEKENIDTSTMESEMQLSLLSALAQNEVESLSQNVRMGVQMKMARGEVMGFNGCLGYDYHPEDKSLTVNKKGKVKWTDSGIRGILKNEKYKGDLLMGKTYTVDPISKRRLGNRGESNKYYTKNHHEAIISEEMWDAVQEIRERRFRASTLASEGTRTRFSRKYALSGMCKCGFCGTTLTRRAHNQDRRHTKPVWKCRTASNKGIEFCPQSKAIDEIIIKNAFVEMFETLAGNFDDVLEAVLSSIEEVASRDDSVEKLKSIKAEIAALERRRKKLTDLFLDDKISKEAYDEKYKELTLNIEKCENEKKLFSAEESMQKSMENRMKAIRARVEGAKICDEFDRFVFESIVEKVIVGGKAEDGTVDPYKLTFVLKGMDNRFIPDTKRRYQNNHKRVV